MSRRSGSTTGVDLGTGGAAPARGEQRALPRALSVALLLLGVLYLVQLVRPLHLESDSVCYIHAAELVAQGQGSGCPGCDRTHCSIRYPGGYPWTLALLIRAGVAGAVSFVLLNLVCLAVGLLAAARMWSSELRIGLTARLGLSALFLLSWPVFRLANTPLSDFLFLALALGSVLADTVVFRADGLPKQAVALALAALLAAAAFQVRTVGVALAPPLLWGIIGRPERLRWLLAQLRRHIVLAVGGVATLVGAGVLVVARSDYLRVDLRTQYGHGLVATLARTWGYRFTELGELSLNVPAGKLPTSVVPFVAISGAAAALLLGWLLWRRRRVFGPMEALICAVAGVMSIWPFEDARFWLPVLPLLFGLVASGVRDFIRDAHGRSAVALAVGLFACLGLAGQAYNTRISLALSQFPLRFSDDYLGPVYRAAFGVPLPGDTLPVDPTALHVLRRFEPRAHPATGR